MTGIFVWEVAGVVDEGEEDEAVFEVEVVVVRVMSAFRTRAWGLP